MKVHARNKVKEYFEASGMSVSEFARRLNCHRQNVYDIFKRQTIDVVCYSVSPKCWNTILLRICMVSKAPK